MSTVVDSAAAPTRLAMRSTKRDRGQGWDGVWWPRSRDLAAEVPALLGRLDLPGAAVSRVDYHLGSWDAAARLMEIDGHRVRLGGYRSMDPDCVRLTNSGRLDIVLLVVAPGASSQDADRLMTDVDGIAVGSSS